MDSNITIIFAWLLGILIPIGTYVHMYYVIIQKCDVTYLTYDVIRVTVRDLLALRALNIWVRLCWMRHFLPETKSTSATSTWFFGNFPMFFRVFLALLVCELEGSLFGHPPPPSPPRRRWLRPPPGRGLKGKPLYGFLGLGPIAYFVSPLSIPWRTQT